MFENSDLTAIIVGVVLPEVSQREVEYNLDELEALLKTLGVKVTDRILQKRQKLTPVCLIGTGKIEEIKHRCQELSANLIVFDHELAPPHVRNIQEVTGIQTIDRKDVILEIFGKHARSSVAKTQVEVARLEYLMPKLSHAWSHLQRQRGGGSTQRGLGEKQIEVDRRRVRERISRLKVQIAGFTRDRSTQRKSRRGELNVALVGYTNSGKTTIMNKLTHSDLLARDALFATLDSTVRTIDPKTRPRILLSDTVGFIKNLPHSLVESFKSTLDGVLEADLLCIVVDVAHEQYREQLATTLKVLQEINADAIPKLYIFNKIDAVLDDPTLPKVLRAAYKNAIAISAFSEVDITNVRQKIYQFFEKEFTRVNLTIPVIDTHIISLLYKTSLIYNADYSLGTYVVIDALVSQSILGKVSSYQVSDNESVVLKNLYAQN